MYRNIDEEKRGHLPWKSVYCGNFFKFIDFPFCRGIGHDLRVLIEVTQPRRLCHKKEANFIMSGYKYPPSLLLSSFPPHKVYVYLYWTHKSNGRTWIWSGKKLRGEWNRLILMMEKQRRKKYDLRLKNPEDHSLPSVSIKSLNFSN